MMLYGMVVEETDILRESKVVQVSGRPVDSEGLDTTLNLPPTSCVAASSLSTPGEAGDNKNTCIVRAIAHWQQQESA